VLAGLGLDGLWRRRRWSPRQGVAVTGLLILAVVVEFAAFPLTSGLSRVAAQPVDRWLAAQPNDGAVMQFPLIKSKNGPALYASTFHGKRLAYGFGSFYPPAWQAAEETLAHFPDAASLAVLRRWDVRYIIVSPTLYDAGWADRPEDTWASVRRRLGAQPALRLVGEFPEEPLRMGDRVTPYVQGTRLPFEQGDVLVYELRSK